MWCLLDISRRSLGESTTRAQVWGLVVGGIVYAYCPPDAVAPQPPSPYFWGAARTPEHYAALAEVFFGNFVRIFQRLGWEVGAVIVLADHYQWGTVAAGYVLSLFGALQALAQYAFSQKPRALGTAKRTIVIMELVEACAIACLFTRSGATGPLRSFLSAVFVLASAVFYLANCLTAAPFNELVLRRTREIAFDDVLLCAQYGIFLAFVAAPIGIRASMGDVAGPAGNQNALAACLLCGWSAQAVVNAVNGGGPALVVVASLGAATTMIVIWAMLDPSVGGTGASNTFSWHPVFMAFAWFGWMTYARPERKASRGRRRPAARIAEDGLRLAELGPTPRELSKTGFVSPSSVDGRSGSWPRPHASTNYP